jgi:hypothetical protein
MHTELVLCIIGYASALKDGHGLILEENRTK